MNFEKLGRDVENDGNQEVGNVRLRSIGSNTEDS